MLYIKTAVINYNELGKRKNRYFVDFKSIFH